jgi:hypothetical protein
MGGKGGGGDGGAGASQSITPIDTSHPTFTGAYGSLGFQQPDASQNSTPAASDTAPASSDTPTPWHDTLTPDPSAAPVSDPPPTPTTANPQPRLPLGPSIASGRGLPLPLGANNPAPSGTGGTGGIGGLLGGAVSNPPSYWVGSQYAKPTTKSTAVTTQT